ncbi:MAG: ABC transporter ATP-binding protein [Spirochaetaceae bacterium]|jgi:peptide/nickel transport system ATP-binding protein|nr:ABC transporter ATP-binding protein [Spirochaetaceae bacterium]
MDALITARGVTVVKRSDHTRRIIRGVSLEVGRNECLGLVGESGSGKTTTALALTGMLPLSLQVGEGQVLYQGRDLYGMTAGEMESFWGRETAFIFQDPSSALNPVKTVGAQIAERLTLFSGLSRAEIEGRVLGACGEAGLPQERPFLKKFPHQLSGGMKQRVMIAGALVCSPKLIIADEPTASLDAITARGILRLLGEVQRKHGAALILISHDLSAVREMCTRVCVLHQGRIVEAAPAGEFFSSPVHGAARQLLGAAAAAPPRRGTGPRQILAAEGLTAHYGDRMRRGGAPVFRALSFSIAQDEVFALIGESGSGKTTLARSLSGIIPYSGSLRIEGEELSSLSRKARSRLVQIVFQNPYTALNPERKVQALVEEPLVIHRLGRDKGERAQAARGMLSAVGLDESFLLRFPRELSGGERQRVAIAAALMLHPRLLIADEILSALDTPVQAKIINLLFSLKERFGFSILFITHNIAQAIAIADTVAVMKDGSLVEIAPSAVLAATGGEHPYTRELLGAV